jgi:light-regulated signal transduction histidine kinase (bacteriophytochrome)
MTSVTVGRCTPSMMARKSCFKRKTSVAGFLRARVICFGCFGDRRGSDRSGLGLGLSIARKAVRAHGGEIRIRNMPGKGCVFTIDVPLAAAESVPQAVL